MHKRIKALGPATVANVTCGFDVLGFALQNLGDEVIVSFGEKQGVHITKIEGGVNKLPGEADKNTAGVAVMEYMKALGKKDGISIELYKKLPMGSGTGSSAASAVSAVVAVNALYDNPLSKTELLPFALKAEEVACKAAHADNAAPSLLGGFVIIRSYNPLDVIKIPYPEDMHCALVHPDIIVRTSEARKILSNTIDLKTATAQWGNVASFIAGLTTGDYDIMSRSMHDYIAEPVRAKLIPHFEAIRSIALGNGAIGCGISGSGPSIFALCKSKKEADIVADKMKSVFLSYDIESNAYVRKIDEQGSVYEIL
jgi:homoserine kinase